MKIAVAQLNPMLGDLVGNVERILQYDEQAKAAGASLLVTPELALCGYPPEDLLFRRDFRVACAAALAEPYWRRNRDRRQDQELSGST